MDEFLAEDFEITRAGRMSKERRPAVIDQALRVAANVMRPGFMKKALKEKHKGVGDYLTGEEIEETIRKALTDG